MSAQVRVRVTLRGERETSPGIYQRDLDAALRRSVQREEIRN